MTKAAAYREVMPTVIHEQGKRKINRAEVAHSQPDNRNVKCDVLSRPPKRNDFSLHMYPSIIYFVWVALS